MRGITPLKKVEKQKRKVVHNLHYLKGIAVDTFEGRKAELTGDLKDGFWFLPLRIYLLPKLGCAVYSFQRLLKRTCAMCLLLFDIQKNWGCS